MTITNEPVVSSRVVMAMLRIGRAMRLIENQRA